MLRRSLLRQIRGTLGRYLAIFFIIVLGVGFFAGLRVSTDTMVETADDYLRSLRLYDFRLVSTLGLTEQDVRTFSHLEGIQAAEGSVSEDLLYLTEDGSQAVLHAHTLLRQINGLDLVAGRRPLHNYECLLDSRVTGGEAMLGQKLTLTRENPQKTLDAFAYDEYTVVGLVNASAYINFERGTTSLGSGTVAGFVYLPSGGFSTDYYTEIYLTLTDGGPIYSSEYDDAVEAKRGEVEFLLDRCATIRRDSLLGDADSALSSAQEILDDADRDMRNARKKVNDGWDTYYRERSDAKSQLADALQTLENTRAALDQGRSALSDGQAALKAQQDEAYQKFSAAQLQLDGAKAQLEKGSAQLKDCRTLLSAGTQLMQALALRAGILFFSPSEMAAALRAGTDPVLMAVAPQILTLSGSSLKEFNEGWKSAETGLGAPLSIQTLTALEQKLKEAQREYDGGVQALERSRLEAQTQFDQAQARLDQTRAQLQSGEADYAAGLAAYESAVRKANRDLSAARDELTDAQQKIRDAQPDLEEGHRQLSDAREDAKELSTVTTYVLDRSSNIGYASLKNDTAIVAGISRIFPLFFFLVAALVCITTMTRMVDEQRTQNGVLKALGFSDGVIISQYLVYAGSASLLGCITGFLLGSRYLPLILWEIYQIIYSVNRPADFVLNWGLFAGCTALYLFCALGATYLVCHRELTEVPAELIRPKAPAAGKRIFLERLPFLWKRVKFLHKVSIRNILRYKKRMAMMILGIGGCTALLLTGFGIRDSIKNIVNFQYDEIDLYDARVFFLETPDALQRAKFLDLGGTRIKEDIFLYTAELDVTAGGRTDSVNVVAYEEPPAGFVDLHAGSSPVAWPETGEAVINYRLARDCGIEVGDSMELRGGDGGPLLVTVSGIFDNYINDYVYLRSDTLADQWGAAPECKTAYLCFADGEDPHAASAVLLEDNNVAGIHLNADMRAQVGAMLKNMDYVVLIVLVCAGALAFIVLYNLTNISITERMREIATLKVLGFYSSESAAYVFRENLVLTGISAVCGIPMGLALVNYVISQIKISAMYFGCRLEPMSYVWSVLITFVFAFLVDLFLYPKLDRINMAEALKAIE